MGAVRRTYPRIPSVSPYDYRRRYAEKDKTGCLKQCSALSSVKHIMIAEHRDQDLGFGYTDDNQAKREKSHRATCRV